MRKRSYKKKCVSAYHRAMKSIDRYLMNNDPNAGNTEDQKYYQTLIRYSEMKYNEIPSNVVIHYANKDFEYEDLKGFH